MAKIIAPNKQYCGMSASVSFTNGEGYTDNSHLIDWFKNHGYEVEQDEVKQGNVEEVKEVEAILELDNMTVEKLQKYAAENNIDLGKSTSKEGILKKIKEAK